MKENKENKDTDLIFSLLDNIEVTEEVDSQPLQLEIEATEEFPQPTKPSTRALLDEADKEPSREYGEKHIYVWWSKDSKGGWILDHTHPKGLKFRLLIRRASMEDKEVRYAGKIYKKFADFEYSYLCRTNPRKDCNPGDSMKINKYSLTPDGEEEKENREKCKREMKFNSNLTKRTYPRF